MEFSVSAYQKLINFLIPRKFDFVDSVIVNKVGYKMGTFYGEFTVKFSPKIKKILNDDCYQKLINGEKLSFWSVALCSKKRPDLVGVEKELEKAFKELTGLHLPGVGVIKTDFEL